MCAFDRPSLERVKKKVKIWYMVLDRATTRCQERATVLHAAPAFNLIFSTLILRSRFFYVLCFYESNVIVILFTPVQ